MRVLLACLRPLWLKFFKLYAIRGNVICQRDLHLGIGSKVYAPNRLTIGRDVYIGKLCTIECDGEIGDEVMIANAVGIVGRHDHDYTAVGTSIRKAPWVGDRGFAKGDRRTGVVIGSDVWIGYGAIVLGGTTVGRGAIVAAGSVVTRDVRPYAIVAGNPAREVGSRFSDELAARHEQLLKAKEKTASNMGGVFRRVAVVLATGAVLVLISSGLQRAMTAPPATNQLAAEKTFFVDNVEMLKRIAATVPGATIVLQPGRYNVGALNLTDHSTLHAPKGAEVVGNLIVRGPHSLVRGLTILGGTIDLAGSSEVTIAECTFKEGTTAIKVDNASNALIINNDFFNVRGGVITGWGLDQSTISGNHFFRSGQAVDLHFNNDRTRGRNITVERNIFAGTARMAIEVGPVGAYTENFVVRDNWAEDFRNRGPDPGDTMSTFVAYSIVPTYGSNTQIVDNYAVAGASGRGAIGIELDGSGEISRNTIRNFNYGAIVYGAGFDVHENTLINTTQAPVLNYSGKSGRITLGLAPTALPKKPDRPNWSP